MKTNYDKAIDALKESMINELNGVSISSEEEKKIQNNFYNEMQKYVKNVSCIKKFTGISVDFDEVIIGLSSLKPFTIDTDQGPVTFIHGAPNGDVAIQDINGGPKLVPYTSEEFAEIVEVQETWIVSCYPGGKADSWETSGKKFFNIGNKLRPLGLAVENGTLYIGYVSPYHQQFIEKDYAKLREKFAAAAK